MLFAGLKTLPFPGIQPLLEPAAINQLPGFRKQLTLAPIRRPLLAHPPKPDLSIIPIEHALPLHFPFIHLPFKFLFPILFEQHALITMVPPFPKFPFVPQIPIIPILQPLALILPIDHGHLVSQFPIIMIDKTFFPVRPPTPEFTLIF
jgi:hypothetical protein